jgi:serine phosphatase RsbU (regulator of sigma subunit)
VIGVWRQDEIADLARFMSSGLYSPLMRDPEGSFIFLLTSMAAAAHGAAKSQQAAELARRLQHEVDSVRRLQESVIPRELPQPSGYELAARYESSQIHVSGFVPVAMAGGDYYDVFELDDQTLVLLVGDASGHGIKACMSIMTMHTLIRVIESQRHPCTGNFMMEVNRRLCSNEIVREGGGFITLLYSTLDLANHRLRWTSAGSPMPLLQDLETNVVTALGNEDHAGLPLAIEDSWVYQCFESDLPENSRLLIYTDGLEEAFPITDEGHDQFGVDGIISSLKSSAELPLEEALERLFSDSTAYTRGHGRLDDTSALLVERKS